ncbi:MAG: T9SS type A sorting domain-containing protein [Saprospiraceae bacterium]
MRHIYLLSCFLVFALGLSAQSSSDLTMQIKTTVQKSPALIHFDWTSDPSAISYQIFRKHPDAISWGSVLANLTTDVLSWEDTNVEVGKAYEYRFIKTAGSYFGYAYALAGIEIPAVEQRGIVILVVENTYWADIQSRIERLSADLRGDGWQVSSILVNRTDAVTSVKSKIKAVYTANPGQVKSVFLFGRVPVPYSGDLNPDGHPDHLGAWPADVFYGDMDGFWSDESVNNTVASRNENDNIPGDGKYDQSLLPSDLELEVGRVDMANMPLFGAEVDLLKAYLDKDHGYRQNEIIAPRVGIVDDNFGTFSGESFATSGWRSIAMLQSPDSVSNKDYRTALNTDGAQWAYGCGGGSYTSAGGIGNSNEIATDSLKGIFSMLFGSYFGDWDVENNFLRSPLANKGTVLTNVWSGRPHWYFHTMGLGRTIGQASKASQNNNNTYFASYGARFTHMALMGDPSLRHDIVSPPRDLVLTTINGQSQNHLQWTAADGAIEGYYIYRADSLNGIYQRISDDAVNATEFIDSCPAIGDNYYMVRTMVLTLGNSGSYYNLSKGIFGNQSIAGNLLASFNPPVPLCASQTYQAAYLIEGPNCPGNQIIAYLSDQNGVFADPPLTVGSQVAEIGGFLTFNIPDNTPSGTGYKVKLETTSPVHSESINASFEVLGKVLASFTWELVNQEIVFQNTSINASDYHWIFADGSESTIVNPTIPSPGPGSYSVLLIASNVCEMMTIQVNIVISKTSDDPVQTLILSPNPIGKNGIFNLTLHDQLNCDIQLFSLDGKLQKAWKQSNGQNLNIQEVPSGQYMLRVSSGAKIWNCALAKME